jgi:ATP-binding cassette subfamily C protein
MLELLKKLWSLFSRKDKIEAVVLVLMMIVGALLEVVGIGLIMPIVALLSKPELIEQNKYLAQVQHVLQPASQESFVLILCGMVVALYVGKNLFLLLLSYIQSNFIYGKITSFSTQLYGRYMHAPYKFHLNHNSSHLVANFDIVIRVCNEVVMSLLMLLAESAVIAAIFIMLLCLSPLTTLALGVLSGLFVVITYYPLKSYNYHLGRIAQFEERQVKQHLLQGLEGVKECKVRNAEEYFCAAHAEHQSKRNQALKMMYFTGQIPRFFLEAMIILLGMGTLAAFVMVKMPTGSIILSLSLLAVSMIRLTPSLSRIQYYLARIRQSLCSFDEIEADLTQLETDDKSANPVPIDFEKSIKIDHLTFAYEGTQPPIFNKYSLEIPRLSSTAFVGTTGCGKTTLVDILLGLLKPQSGQVLVDGRNIENNLASWQAKIGYVPQTIYLLDDTVRANVAYGVPPEEVDTERVRQCLKTAQVLGVVEALSEGLDTLVGEKGVRLSGGQRQRIGIARALYHDPELLILDEATSALDHETERAFIDAVNTLKGKLTIIMIAHRLGTVENCDAIVKLTGV